MSKRETNAWDAIKGIGEAFARGLTDWKTAGVAVAGYVSWVYSLSQADRLHAAPESLMSFLGSEPFLLGVVVVLSMLLLVVGGLAVVAVTMKNKQLHEQGVLLQKFREHSDPSRLSSDNMEDVLSYPERVKEEIQARRDTPDKQEGE